jgi:ABC-type transport system substrate-binding protein
VHDGFRVVKLPANPTVSIDFDLLNEKAPWHDRRVRLAIAHAIDGDAIVKGLFHGVPERHPRLAPGEFGSIRLSTTTATIRRWRRNCWPGPDTPMVL